MDPNIVLLVAAAALVTLFFFRSFAGKCSPSFARQLVSMGAKLVDVRSPGEFGAGHIDGAINVPLHELAGRAEDLGERDAPIVLYCRSGARSGRAKRMLAARGFTEVHDLGAMTRWS
jgi:rhodanese-related sulfurtransferase